MKSEDFVGVGACAGVGDVQQLVQNCGGAVGNWVQESRMKFLLNPVNIIC
jgi:hypothetical protein